MKNENKKLRDELQGNLTKEKIEKLAELLKVYDLAKLGRDVQEAEFKEIDDNVLGENEFFAVHEYTRSGGETIRKGDRITDSTFDFLLSEDDFHRLYDLCRPHHVAQGLTDENDRYVTDWMTIWIDAERALVDFIIDEIIPESLRNDFETARRNVVYHDKLIGIARGMFKDKEAA